MLSFYADFIFAGDGASGLQKYKYAGRISLLLLHIFKSSKR
jgi:hypothetical protein